MREIKDILMEASKNGLFIFERLFYDGSNMHFKYRIMFYKSDGVALCGCPDMVIETKEFDPPDDCQPLHKYKKKMLNKIIKHPYYINHLKQVNEK